MGHYRRDDVYIERGRRISGALAAGLETALEGVDGWLHADEATGLHEAARLSAAAEPVVVEIGSWMGRSTIALARGLERRDPPSGRVIAIDPHTGSPEHHAQWGAVDTYDTFIANLDRAGVRERVEPCRAMSHEARAQLDPDRVDVLFVDGAHEYAAVMRDLDDWLPLVAPGGIAAFNDVVWPGVLIALLRRVLRPRSGFVRPAILDNTLFVTRAAGPVAVAETARVTAFAGELALRFLLARATMIAGRLRTSRGR